MKRALLAALLLGASSTQAAPDDFARGRTLEVTEGGDAQRLILPQDVYEWVTRSDLGDLRVFNAAQEEVPYAVRRPRTLDEYSPWQALPLFALPPSNAGHTVDSRVDVEVDERGTIVAIRGGVADASARPAFLVDATTLEQPATELRLDWQVPDAADSVSRLRVDASDDLNEWRELAQTTVVRLSSDARTVHLDRIDLPAASYRYLRISQLTGAASLSVSAVEARRRRSQLPARQWKSLRSTVVDGGFEFDSGGRFPIDRVLLELEEPAAGHLVTAELLSRTSPDSGWQTRGSYTFYRTTVGGRVAESEPVAVAEAHQQWRVVAAGEALTTPMLKIGWLPDELVFLKQGAAPYLLAYGQGGVTGRQWPLQQLQRQLNGEALELAEVPLARLGDAQSLGGPSRLEPPAEPIDWRTIILWVVLVIGVGMVGALAYRVLKSAPARPPQP